MAGAKWDGLPKKLTLWGGAFLVVVSVMGLLNKWIIADPIQDAVREERVARQYADSLLISEIRILRYRDVPAVDQSVADVEQAAEEAAAATKVQVRVAADRNFKAVQRLEEKLDLLLQQRGVRIPQRRP